MGLLSQVGIMLEPVLLGCPPFSPCEEDVDKCEEEDEEGFEENHDHHPHVVAL